MGPERRYQTSLIAELRKRGAWVVKYPAGPHGTIGVPDLLACYRGLFLAIECKAKREPPTAMQQRQLDGIVSAGGMALVAWPGLDLDPLWEQLDEQADALAEAVGSDPAS